MTSKLRITWKILIWITLAGHIFSLGLLIILEMFATMNLHCVQSYSIRESLDNGAFVAAYRIREISAPDSIKPYLSFPQVFIEKRGYLDFTGRHHVKEFQHYDDSLYCLVFRLPDIAICDEHKARNYWEREELFCKLCTPIDFSYLPLNLSIGYGINHYYNPKNENFGPWQTPPQELTVPFGDSSRVIIERVTELSPEMLAEYPLPYNCHHSKDPMTQKLQLALFISDGLLILFVALLASYIYCRKKSKDAQKNNF